MKRDKEFKDVDLSPRSEGEQSETHALMYIAPIPLVVKALLG